MAPEEDNPPSQRVPTPPPQSRLPQRPHLSPLNIDIPSAMDVDPEPTFGMSGIMDTAGTTSASDNDTASALLSTPPSAARTLDEDVVMSPPSPLSPLPPSPPTTPSEKYEPDITEDTLRLDEEQRVKAQSLGNVDLSGLPDWASKAYDQLSSAGYGSSMMCILHDWAWLEACFIAVSLTETIPIKYYFLTICCSKGRLPTSRHVSVHRRSPCGLRGNGKSSTTHPFAM